MIPNQSINQMKLLYKIQLVLSLILVRNIYKCVKILIVMCWDHTCSDVEDPKLSLEVLRNGVDGNNIRNINFINII